MYLDWGFAFSVLPLILVSGVFLYLGFWFDERAAKRPAFRRIGLGLKFVALIGAGAIVLLGVLNFVLPIAAFAYCLFAACG